MTILVTRHHRVSDRYAARQKRRLRGGSGRHLAIRGRRLRVLVLGATGGTGREVVRAAAAKGHSVVALVRSKAKAAVLAGAELVEGDARDEDALARALQGCSGVISALGTSISPFREVTLLSTATLALVRTMDRQSVRRLVCITGLGAGDSRGHGGFVFDRLIMPLFLRKGLRGQGSPGTDRPGKRPGVDTRSADAAE